MKLTQQEEDAITGARNLLNSYGFVVLREKSYRQAQERQRCAEVRAQCAEEDAAHARYWAQQELCSEIRDLRARCTYLYGEARAKGATAEELAGVSVGGRA